MAEFIELEANQKGLVNLDPKDYVRVLQLSLSCENRRLSKWAGIQYNFLNAVRLRFQNSSMTLNDMIVAQAMFIAEKSSSE